MARFEYGITIKGEETPTDLNHRELVVEQLSEGYIRIALKENDGAIVSFLQDGTIKIYGGTAKGAGFKPVIF